MTELLVLFALGSLIVAQLLLWHARRTYADAIAAHERCQRILDDARVLNARSLQRYDEATKLRDDALRMLNEAKVAYGIRQAYESGRPS